MHVRGLRSPNSAGAPPPHPRCARRVAPCAKGAAPPTQKQLVGKGVMKTTTGAFQRVVKSGLQAAVGANNYQRREKNCF